MKLLGGTGRYLAILAGLQLAGCGEKQQDGAPGAETVRKLSSVPASSTHGEWQFFRCDNGQVVQVRYSHDPASQEQAVAAVSIGGATYRMTAEKAASGARYISPDGPHRGKRLVWWEERAGMWLERPIDASTGGETLIATCTPAGSKADRP